MHLNQQQKDTDDKHAQEIKDLIDNTKDIDELRIWIHIVNMVIKVESFGISWEENSRQKNKTNKDSKEINKLFLEQQEELDNLSEEGACAKDLSTKIYKIKDLINGPK